MKIYNPQVVPVGNTEVLQPIPRGDIAEADPFLLLHHAEKKTVEPGHGFYVGPHPHRGFQPITFVFDGEVHHKDSLGNDSIVKTNGVQWINAGSGLMHSEGMSKNFQENGGDFEIIQLWVNVSKENKLSLPTYYSANETEMGLIESDETRVYVVSGKINDTIGPVDNFSNITSAMVKSKGNDSLKLNFKGNSKLVYVLSGSVEVNETELMNFQMIQLDDTDEIELKINGPSRLLVLGGDKINEPIKAWGPYVMNTQTEIMEALRDFQMGKMGYLSD